MENPLVDTINIMANTLSSSLKIHSTEVLRQLLEPVKEEYGDFSFPAMRYTKDANTLIQNINSALGKKANIVDTKLLRGFLNFVFKEELLLEKTINYIKDGNKVKTVEIDKPLTIVVEHTSANPIHPLHMGHARNSCLGDTISRLLNARGHRVNRRFYVDDVGRQSVIAALGFKVIDQDPIALSERLNIKPDKLVGWVYAVSSTTIDLISAKEKNDKNEEEKLASILARLRQQVSPSLFDTIFDKLSEMPDIEKVISNIMVRYEKGLEPEKSLIRSIANAVLEGFKNTLERLEIHFDHWDWESDILWGGLVDKVIESVRKNKYYMIYKDAEAINIPQIIKDFLEGDKNLSKSFDLPKFIDIPPLIIRRSDGSTLYTTRDIAYSIYKFQVTKANKVINVIGTSQRLPQLQIRLALLALGYTKEATNLIHYGYEIVRLPGRAMHGRRGEYLTLDDALDEIRERAYFEIKERNQGIDNTEAKKLAEKVAVGAIRYAMVHLNSSKPLTFDIKKAVNLKESSGPYLQYTYVRAKNILEKHGEIDYESIDNNAVKEKLRRTLFINALKYSLVSAKAADDMAPEDLVSYMISLSDLFNQWYEVDSVLHEKDRGAREMKAFLVSLVKQVLEDGLTIIGIPLLERL
ncbi:MAG: arginine--tRNA ligase [Caldisphaeraceae archaeon]|nr:arginine--tRNA ligase [Caldisphaeraceae archaeon]